MTQTTPDDDLYETAKNFVVSNQNGSTSFLQRNLGLTYNKGASLIERMVKEGVVSDADLRGKRTVLRKPS